MSTAINGPFVLPGSFLHLIPLPIRHEPSGAVLDWLTRSFYIITKRQKQHSAPKKGLSYDTTIPTLREDNFLMEWALPNHGVDLTTEMEAHHGGYDRWDY